MVRKQGLRGPLPMRGKLASAQLIALSSPAVKADAQDSGYPQQNERNRRK